MNGNSLHRDAMRRVVQAVLGESRQVEVLHRRGDGTVFRWRDGDGASLVVKVWRRPDFLGVVRRCLRIDSASYEWRSMVRLHRAGLHVPQPLGRCRMEANALGFTDAILMEDMGGCTQAAEYIKKLIADGDEMRVESADQQLVEMTAVILAARMIDTDHSLVNIFVRDDGELLRLDFEMARWVGLPRLFRGMYGRMLGRLLSSYTFAVQPDDQRVRRFARGVASKLAPPTRAMQAAQRYLDAMLEEQRARRSIDMRVPNVWGG